MGTREVESLAAWKPFSLFLRFSQESMIASGEAPFCQKLPHTPQACIREERHLAESGLLACTWEGLTLVLDDDGRRKGRFREVEKWSL